MELKRTNQSIFLLVLCVVMLASVAVLATPPIVNGGGNQTMVAGRLVQLQGIASDPVDGDTIGYWEWTITQGPTGHDGSLASSNGPSPRFTATVVGQYTVAVQVIDSQFEQSTPDFILIDVVEDFPPVAVLSASVTEGPAPLTVTFDGSDSYDLNGEELQYYWNFGDGYTATSPTVEHTYASPGFYTAFLRVFDDGGNHNNMDTIIITVTPGGNIQVSPEVYDFGDVELGSSSSTIITITNPVGGIHEDPLGLLDISFADGSSGDFAITTNPVDSPVLPGESVDIGVSFTPSAEGYVSAVLQITSDDPVFELIEVSLGGVGVYDEQPPEGQIAATLSFIDASVDAGTLVGDGSGNSAGKRLNAFENMIEACGDLIADGLDDQACDQLEAALKKCDGQPSPPDFVTGDAAEVLKSMIEVLRTTLGCE